MEQLLPFNDVVTEIENPVPGEAHHLEPMYSGTGRQWSSSRCYILFKPAPSYAAPAQDLQENAAPCSGYTHTVPAGGPGQGLPLGTHLRNRARLTP